MKKWRNYFEIFLTNHDEISWKLLKKFQKFFSPRKEFYVSGHGFIKFAESFCVIFSCSVFLIEFYVFVLRLKIWNRLQLKSIHWFERTFFVDFLVEMYRRNFSGTWIRMAAWDGDRASVRTSAGHFERMFVTGPTKGCRNCRWRGETGEIFDTKQWVKAP